MAWAITLLTALIIVIKGALIYVLQQVVFYVSLNEESTQGQGISSF